MELKSLLFLASLLSFSSFTRADGPLVERGAFPNRVHVFEDFETTIEKRWWHRGVEESKDLPLSLSALPNTRAWKGGDSGDFDDKMGDKKARFHAVIFNPVPGPPMGKNTRLSFNYKLTGADKMRVQIFSLSNNYHRMLDLTGLVKDKWAAATVDMTKLRRPDGTGGPLSEDERIDDIQFYIDPKADVIIDDIVLYDAAAEAEKEPFPARIIYTGWFDTGKQGKGNEWPGDFEIVKHEAPRTWKAAKSVINAETKAPWLRIDLRGERPLPPRVRVRFRYRLSKEAPVQIVLASPEKRAAELKSLKAGTWAEASIDLNSRTGNGEKDGANEIQFLLPEGVELMVDDLLIYEPGK